MQPREQQQSSSLEARMYSFIWRYYTASGGIYTVEADSYRALQLRAYRIARARITAGNKRKVDVYVEGLGWLKSPSKGRRKPAGAVSVQRL